MAFIREKRVTTCDQMTYSLTLSRWTFTIRVLARILPRGRWETPSTVIVSHFPVAPGGLMAVGAIMDFSNDHHHMLVGKKG